MPNTINDRLREFLQHLVTDGEKAKNVDRSYLLATYDLRDRIVSSGHTARALLKELDS